ncbi:MAG: D-alanyl-D-alanine dipeptidase [Pelagibacterales bacterium]|nr:D-alanyl-D-alanine dipeptidase [Pelagibacterales bacterium]|tara:strand:- start:775 stop:1305 length:531 start_codon:yes stop_codon:yes gene_type:complete
MALIEIKKNKFDIDIDLRYATKNNITGRKIFREGKCFLESLAAEKLFFASKIAKDFNCRLKIFDAYRPQYVQEALWKFCPDPDFLTHPKKGSPHTRGVAVDLTLTKNNVDLDMGTDFDDFTEKAYHLSKNVSLESRRNRSLLLSIMILAGFDFYEKEWWHYQLYNSKNFSLIKNIT